MKIRELAEGIGELQTEFGGDLDIGSITHDSRKVQHGTLFVAIEGSRMDGHRYIACACQLGAVCVATASPEKVHFSVPVLKVEDPRKAMALLARRLHGYPDRDLKVIGVTGTNGKTTTTYLINGMLRSLGNCGRIGTLSYFNGISEEKAVRTTPESSEIFACLGEMMTNSCKYASIEISSHGLMFDRVLGLELQYALFTNLSKDHLDFHHDMESYFQAKHKQFHLLREGGVAVINWDDDYGRRIEIEPGRRLVRFGQHKDADLRFEILSLNVKGSQFKVFWEGREAVFEIPLMGAHNVYNYTGALAVALCEGRDLEEIATEGNRVQPVPGRMETLNLGQPFGVVVDFAHTPDALEKVLLACSEINPKRLILVFGAGGDRDQSKRPEMGATAHRFADIIVLTSDNPRGEDPEAIMDHVEAGIERPEGSGYIREGDRRQAIHQAIRLAKPGDLVLIAGKGHETTQEVRGRHYPFDDREVAARFLQLLHKGKDHD